MLLLLEALTHDHPAIQKIVAFNGGFERLLEIAHHEGLTDGGMSCSEWLEGRFVSQMGDLELTALWR